MYTIRLTLWGMDRPAEAARELGAEYEVVEHPGTVLPTRHRVVERGLPSAEAAHERERELSLAFAPLGDWVVRSRIESLADEEEALYREYRVAVREVPDPLPPLTALSVVNGVATLTSRHDGVLLGDGVESVWVVHDDNLGEDRGWFAPGALWANPDRVTPRLGEPPEQDWPGSYMPVGKEGVAESPVFDPALKGYSHGFRVSAVIADEARRLQWWAARRAAMNHVLDVVSRSELAPRLMLRGSAAMGAWFGDQAREPGDLDFVVVPHTLRPDTKAGEALMDALVDLVYADPGPGLRAEYAGTGEIWTYERAEGRRLVFPYDGGTVQVDVVFGEELPLPPEELIVPGVERPVLAATRELSLAWKLMWLASDMYPQGKDLYDAVLLAEAVRVDAGLVRQMLRDEIEDAGDWEPEDLLDLDIHDWEEFRAEYPRVEGEPDGWAARLVRALEG
ncbi:hypothetical protein Afil01_60210 [Actinorhabdospora filicis]|uniref:Nucleotidyltransferase AbiEii toxin of type IV toxin-antitoxin system n=1 Tax=Actinorhabdospora filicis TaxID=1785913 RepID=A0A9W6WC23_9ACTN|nr:nucleotidyl transferase AbiEii/AbiGii toxin family protein [Actinorhabdospora filicis]GLZ81214.1 hypothetical protein Afil01_60210 [Actinorhabdospora filicis]